jgi:hypothetical protein
VSACRDQAWRAAAKLLAGWLVIDLDGTLITAHRQEGAAPTLEKGFTAAVSDGSYSAEPK